MKPREWWVDPALLDNHEKYTPNMVSFIKVIDKFSYDDLKSQAEKLAEALLKYGKHERLCNAEHTFNGCSCGLTPTLNRYFIASSLESK